MNRRLSEVATFIAFLFVFALNATAQQGHSIRGKVHNDLGVNLARVTINLETGTGSLISQTVTNNEGDFFFGGLGETSYVVVVSAPDYNPVSERIDFVRRVSADQPGETRSVEITLLPKVAAAAITPRPASAFFQNVPAAARSALERALKLSKQGKPDLAQALLREAIKLFPDYFDAHFALGSELTKAGRLDEAIAELERARQVNPKDDRVYEVFGLVLMQQRKYAVAAAVFAEASRLNPLDAQSQLLRAIALIEQTSVGNGAQSTNAAERDYIFTEAENSLTRAYNLSGGKLAVVRLHRARLYERKGERERAAQELEQYLKESSGASNSDAIHEAIKKLRSPSGRN